MRGLLGARMVAVEHPALPVPVREPDVLALVDPDAASMLAAGLPGFLVVAETDAARYLDGVASHRTRICVIACPPASPALLEQAAAIRRRRPALRCMLINERADVEQRLHALELGFDAALARDTPDSELLGRLLLLARDRRSPRDRVAVGDGLELDLSRGNLVRNGRNVHLRPKEFRLLELLARHPGRVYTRRELLERVWGVGPDRNPRTVDVHVRWIRSKIERDPNSPTHLTTVRGVGYRLDPEAL
jgi:DNA-binding response OmpR family regulator